MKDQDRFPEGIRAVYRLETELGRGATGRVARATHRGLDRPVVLKMVRMERTSPDWQARIRREARLLAQLEHPRVVRLLDQGEVDGWLYMAFPEEGARDLRVAHEAQGLGAEERLRPILVDVLEGLEALHEAGVVHRDLKPGNILVDANGRAQLIDLGLAKILDASYTQTATGVFLGTPLYASPGLCLGEPPCPRDDLYALGVLAYELSTGSNPFEGEDLGACLERHLHHRPPDPRREGAALSPGLASWILAMMAREPADRPESATAAREWLQRTEAAPTAGTVALDCPAATAALPAPAPDPPPAEPPSPPRWLRGVAALGVTLLAAFVGYLAQRPPPRPAAPPPPTSPSRPPPAREVPASVQRGLEARRPDLPWPRSAPPEVVAALEAIVEVPASHQRLVDSLADRRAAAVLGGTRSVIRGMIRLEFRSPATFDPLREEFAPLLAVLGRARLAIAAVDPEARDLPAAALHVVLDECWLVGPALGLTPPAEVALGNARDRLLTAELRVQGAPWHAYATDGSTGPWLRQAEDTIHELSIPHAKGPWDEVLRARLWRHRFDLTARLHKDQAGVAALGGLAEELGDHPPAEQVAAVVGLGEAMLDRHARSMERFAVAALARQMLLRVPDAPRAELLVPLAAALVADND